MRCKYCGSQSVHSSDEYKGFSAGKAIAGTIAFGAIGAIAGATGRKTHGYRCGACGQFMDSLMDYRTEQNVNDAVYRAEHRGDTSMYSYYKKQYGNIEDVAVQSKGTDYRDVQNLSDNARTASSFDWEEKEEDAVKRSYFYGLWQPKSPVYVHRINIKNNGNEDALALEMVNQSGKDIRSLYLQANVYDDTGDLLSTVRCVYQNVNVKAGAAFPEQKVFGLGTDLAYKVDILCEKAAYDDGEVWRETGEKAIVLQEQTTINARSFPRYSYMKEEYRKVQSHTGTEGLDMIDPAYLPMEENSFWQCTCGTPVQGAVCPHCHCGIEDIQKIFSQEHLLGLQHDAVLKRAAERAAKTMSAHEAVFDEKSAPVYKEALGLMQEGSFKDLEKAAALFASIKKYKDSESKSTECRKVAEERREIDYQTLLERIAAVEKMEMKEDSVETAALEKWESIQAAVIELGEYKSSTALLEKCRWNISDIKKRSQEIEEKQAEARAKKTKRGLIIAVALAMIAAVAVFLTLKVFIPNGKYNNAVKLMEEGKYEEAIAAFEALEGHKDSEELIGQCKAAIEDAAMEEKYQQAIGLLQAEKYEEAIAAFEALTRYKDSVEQIEICKKALEDVAKEEKYQAALQLMKEGKYKEALAAFTLLNGYKDSKEQMENCSKLIDEENEKKYQVAVDLMEAGKYEEAVAAFKEVLKYKDSEKQIGKIRLLYTKESFKGVKVGSTVIFGSYEQDNVSANGTEWIEWEILEIKDDKALIISKYALDCKNYSYGASYYGVSWEDSYLRGYLNEVFSLSAFSLEERNLIADVDSLGNIFVLDSSEAKEYYSLESDRICKPTAYAEARGTWSAENGGCCWWLRSPGTTYYAKFVSFYGAIMDDEVVKMLKPAVRPALWINLSAIND